MQVDLRQQRKKTHFDSVALLKPLHSSRFAFQIKDERRGKYATCTEEDEGSDSIASADVDGKVGGGDNDSDEDDGGGSSGVEEEEEEEEANDDYDEDFDDDDDDGNDDHGDDVEEKIIAAVPLRPDVAKAPARSTLTPTANDLSSDDSNTDGESLKGAENRQDSVNDCAAISNEDIGAGSTGPDLEGISASDLRHELAGEAHRSLSIISSLFGVAAPAPNIAPLVPNSETRGQVNSTGFTAVERYWGDAADDSCESETGDTEAATVFSRAAEGAADGEGIFSAKWQALKMAFPSDSKANLREQELRPSSSFAQGEDPTTLSGFASFAERETTKQSHSFGFSFGLMDHGSEQQQQQDFFRDNTEAPSQVEGKVGDAEDGALDLWTGFSRLVTLAETYLAPRTTAEGWLEHRQQVLRDVKRKLRRQIPKRTRALGKYSKSAP